MPDDTFTEVTSQSWFSRIGSSIKGILFGLVLLVVAFPLLFWNEGRAVRRSRTLKEGSGIVLPVSPAAIAAENEGKLVHATATAETDEILADETFGVTAAALKLKRTVTMYQWKESAASETRKKLGGGTETVTTYSYSRVWSEGEIDSSGFKEPEGHQNPAGKKYPSRELQAGEVRFGAFTLPRSLVNRISAYEPVPVDSGTVPEAVREGTVEAGGGLYVGNDPGSPQIGDLKIAFARVPNTTVSIVSKQSGTTFEPYLSGTGGSLQLLQVGTHSAESMFERARQENTVWTWVLRLAGFLLMAFGMTLILRPLSVLADVVPFIGSLVGLGTGLISFLISAVLSLATVAIAWFAYRPLLSIGLLAAAAAMVFLIRKRARTANHAGAGKVTNHITGSEQ